MLVRSPRTWGWTGQRLAGEDPYQAFPTHVGMDRVRWYRRIEGFRVPHARGDGPTLRWSCRPPRRRSPRTWGWTDYDLHFWLTRVAFPTCVGNAGGPIDMGRTAPVHPHVRGERRTWVGGAPSVSGPSPRAWGTPLAAPCRSPPLRSIPTCVGNATNRYGWDVSGAVHPHVRGERPVVFERSRQDYGPSPRAWGTQGHGPALEAKWRSIPTCVGNALSEPAGATIKPVHPHVRGERCANLPPCGEVDGPSPRAWGTRFPPPARPAPHRSIPTCVGNASTPAASSPALAVHPHVRGERFFQNGQFWTASGPSPRAWGTRPRRGSEIQRTRSIPTCVGNATRVNQKCRS